MRGSISICIILTIASTIEILVKIIKAVISKIQERDYSLNHLLRPSLTLIAALAAIYHLTAIENEAKAELWQLANKVQATCEAQNKCPTMPDGWIKDEYGHPKMMHYVGATEFRMRYETYDNGNCFAIYLHYGLGEGFVVPGGINKKIEMKATR
jgi:hypothetical protein